MKRLLPFVVAFALLGVACGQIETEVSTTPSIQPPTTTTTTMPSVAPWLTFEASANALLAIRTNNAVFLAEDLGFKSTCSGLTVGISADPEFGYAGFAWGSSPGAPCGILINDEVAVDATWYGDYVVYHEVAHIFTNDEAESHGPRFRQVEAALLRTVGIESRYVTDSEYPDGFLTNAGCYGTCWKDN